jgi:hypothetical protein
MENEEVEKVNYNVRPQDGQAATAQAVEPNRGVPQAEDAELNDAKRQTTPGGQAESRNTKPLTFRDEQGNLYTLVPQDGARAQAEGTEPGRGVAEEQDQEEDGGVVDEEGDRNEMHNPEDNAEPSQRGTQSLRTNSRGQRLSSSFNPVDLAKTVAAELAKLNDATNSDVVKTDLSGKVEGLTKAVKSLADRLEVMEAQEAVRPAPKKYSTVDKVDGQTEEVSEYDALVKQVENLPETATLNERSELAFKLRKAARKN